MPPRATLLLALSLCSCGDDGADAAGAGRGGTGGAAPDDAASPALPACGEAGPTIVSDVDETLTTHDDEFLKQLVDGTHEPAMREGAPELLSAYHDRGYFLLYLTARSEEMVMGGTGETARAATERWLSERGFPTERAAITLAPTNADVFGEPARAYKAAALDAMKASGHVFEYAYGNADSDVHAYADAGIAKDRTFIIGPLAGLEGTVAIEGEGFSAHAEERLPLVPAVCVP